MKINIKLFHGTSTLFKDSIIKNGLGGKNPLIKYQAYDFIKAIYKCGNELWGDNLHHPWQVQKMVLRGMAEQHISGGGFNWRHGETYLTPAMGKAINYAQHNPYGSELISNALYYYKKIIHKYPEENLPEVITTSPILDLLDVSFTPLIIEIPIGVLYSEDLEGETDQDVIQQVKKLKEMDLSNPSDEFLSEQLNFRLQKSITVDELKCYCILPSKKDNIDYELKEIIP